MSKIRLPLCHHRRLGAAQGDERLDEAKLYKELGVLTKEKEKWEESIPYVSSLLNYESVKIQAKVLWLLGEMGLLYLSPCRIQFQPSFPSLTARSCFCGSGQ